MKKEEKKAIELLYKLGIKPMAKVKAYIYFEIIGKRNTCKKLERRYWEAQPIMSKALNEMVAKGILKTKLHRTSGKGRPQIVFILEENTSPITSIIMEKEEEFKKIQEQLRVLKKLIQNYGEVYELSE